MSMLIFAGFLLLSVANAQEITGLEPPQLPGTVEGTGTHFEITDSSYLNVTLDSTETIKLRMESVPEMVTMFIEPASSATSTQITLKGFQPNTTYYKYQDNYHNLTPFTTDSTGSYSYTQNLSQPHLVFIQPRTSTKFIADNATGGDCVSIGTWNPPTKTCTLTTNMPESIQIDSNNVTLDGNGHSLIGNSTGFGVFLSGRSGVVVKNATVGQFAAGIMLYSSNDNTLVNNKVLAQAGVDGIRLEFSNNNTANSNISLAIIGINIGYADNNTISANTTTDNDQGINLNFATGNIITDNNVSLTTPISTSRCIHLAGIVTSSIITGNTITNCRFGVFIGGLSNGNEIYNNNFINNTLDVFDFSGGNVFNLPVPTGGNYYSDFDTPAEGCNNVNSDNFCDSPYVFAGGQDNLPWVRPIVAEKTLPEKAADLAKELVNSAYLYGGKGWDYNQSQFVAPDTLKTGYTYWNQASGTFAFNAGVDCSGLIMWAYDRSFDPNKSRFNNIVKAEGADEQYRNNTTTTTESQLRPGDAMFFDNAPKDGFIDHVAMYVGESSGYDVVSAASPLQGIVPVSKDDLKQLSKFVAFKQVVPAVPLAMLTTSHSPVGLIVTDPDGFTITPTTTVPSDLEYLRQIPGILYYSEMERGADGNPIDHVYSYIAKTGDYIIQVLPASGTPPTATYTIDFSTESQTITLADDVPISRIPNQGYGITTSATGTISSFIPVEIGIEPGTLNLRSKGVFTVFITIPEGGEVDIQGVDTPTIRLEGLPPTDVKIANDKQIIAKFSRQDFSEIVSEGKTQLTMTASLLDGTPIKGVDTIRIIGKASLQQMSLLLANLYSVLSQLLTLLQNTL